MKRKVPKQRKAAYHLWTSLVGREDSMGREDPAFLIAVFARTRKEVCAVLRAQMDPLSRDQISEEMCRKVTVTSGWGGARCADVLTCKDLISPAPKRKGGA